jgi:uncharacterized protein
LIESLFQRLAQGAVQAGPRDPQAEQLIQQHVQNLPGAAYYLVQTALVQEQALQQAEARLQGAQQQTSFLPPTGQPAAAPYGQQPYGQPYGQPPPGYNPQQQQGGGMGGFLAGAGKLALGIGGGILVADAAMGIANGIFGHPGFGQGFGGDRDDDGGRDRDDYGGSDRDDYNQGSQQEGFNQQDSTQEDYSQQDGDQQDSFDSSGDFDSGSGSDW